MTIERRTATELLAQELTLTLAQTAIVLNLRATRGNAKGEPSLRAALALVESGQLRPVDPRCAPGRMTVSCAEVRRYLGIDQVPTTTNPTLSIVKEAS